MNWFAPKDYIEAIDLHNCSLEAYIYDSSQMAVSLRHKLTVDNDIIHCVFYVIEYIFFFWTY